MISWECALPVYLLMVLPRPLQRAWTLLQSAPPSLNVARRRMHRPRYVLIPVPKVPLPLPVLPSASLALVSKDKVSNVRSRPLCLVLSPPPPLRRVGWLTALSRPPWRPTLPRNARPLRLPWARVVLPLACLPIPMGRRVVSSLRRVPQALTCARVLSVDPRLATTDRSRLNTGSKGERLRKHPLV